MAGNRATGLPVNDRPEIILRIRVAQIQPFRPRAGRRKRISAESDITDLRQPDGSGLISFDGQIQVLSVGRRIDPLRVEKRLALDFHGQT